MYETLHNISLVTVPHTGTHFAIELLKTVGLEHRSGSKGIKHNTTFNFFHVHWPHDIMVDWTEAVRNKVHTDKVIITARDPILTGIRYISSGKPITEIAKHWNAFLEYEADFDYFALDVGCLEEKRYEHVCNALRYIEVDPVPFADDLKAYADAWTPLNSKDSDIKQHYLKTEELPDGHNWSIFDEAVAWYKNLPTNAQV